MIERLTALYFSILILFGAAGNAAELKYSFPLEELNLTGRDITSGCTVNISSSGFIRFNRISFDYRATAPLRAVFRYRAGFGTAEEELFLSEKESSASMLLNGYLKRITASRLISVMFEPLVKGRKCTLSVSGFTCDIQAVPFGDTVFIENGRYKAGVSLKWGGGLSYFEDKSSGKYGNMLNNHDTGRLVQQSYYGPSEIEGYENGIYENTVWPYNPVQGGDKYGNASKLVAIEKTDNEIRVVCRPLDWAQDNMFTQTYYTNVYTLTGSGLTVKNTVIDYLQTEWSVKSHELPAFYTISALGNFIFYDGEMPWTDDTLRREDNLGFWSGKPSFPLKEGNTETWCAWADDSGYGIGLFTPGAEALLAGRYEYDGSADPRANSTNYVAPLGFFALKPGEPYTYSFSITAGKINEIRETFKNSRGQ